MIRVLIAFAVLLGAVYLGLQLQTDPGYVLLAMNHWTIESTAWTALIAILLFFLLLYSLLQLIHKIAHLPIALKRWRNKHLTQRAEALTNKGLIEYSEGYWSQAKKHLIQALPNTDAPLLNYLTAARAAQKMGDSLLRDQYLRQAQQSMPEATIAVELTQAQLQLDNQQWEQALATLRHLQDLAPQHPYVLKCLMHLYEEVRDWPQLLALLPTLKKHKVISPTELLQIEEQTYLQSIRTLAKQNQPTELQKLFEERPKSLTCNVNLVREYALYLFQNKEYEKAEVILRHCLKNQYSEPLIRLYGLLPGDEHQLSFAESLLKKNTHSAVLYWCIGRLCLAQNLWGKAKNHLEQANALRPMQETYFALGKLYEGSNEPELACAQYRAGLDLALHEAFERQ